MTRNPPSLKNDHILVLWFESEGDRDWTHGFLAADCNCEDREHHADPKYGLLVEHVSTKGKRYRKHLVSQIVERFPRVQGWLIEIGKDAEWGRIVFV